MLCRRQFLVASLALLGCANSKEEKLAERALQRHFAALKRRTFDSALANYDDHFFDDVTRAEWRVALTSVVDKLGSFRDYEVSSSGVAYREVAGPGSYLRFQLSVSYARHRADETFYLFRKQGAKSYKIVGHQIDSAGLKHK